METKGAKVPLCVAVIIVKSLEHTTMRRMIAVRDLPILATLLGILNWPRRLSCAMRACVRHS